MVDFPSMRATKATRCRDEMLLAAQLLLTSLKVYVRAHLPPSAARKVYG